MEIKEAKDLKEPKGFTLKPVQFIALGFVALILFGSFLLTTPIANQNREWLSFTDALFTATSAVCVTGLQVVDTAINYSLFGQIVILVLIQSGGLGFMTIASVLFLVIGKKITLKERLALQEAYNQNELQGMVKLTKNIIITTGIIELSGAILLSFSFIPTFGWGRGVYYSIFHGISAFCNAGFDLMGVLEPWSSAMYFRTDVVVNIAFMLLITLGSLGFTVINDVRKNRRLSRMHMHTKIVLLLTAIFFVIGTIFFSCMEWNNPDTMGGLNPGQKIMTAMFQSITPRTAGYATVDQAALTMGSKIMTMFYMFVGASPAGTGGGIKTTTLLVLLLLVITGAKGESELNVRDKSIHRRVAFRAVAILLFGLAVIGVSTVAVSIAEIDVLGKNFTLNEILYDCISGFATVGLTEGITQHLSPFSKIVLCFVMLIGRLGTLALGLVVTNKKENVVIKYPDAKILIG